MTTLEDSKDWEVMHGPVPRHVAIIMDGNGRWAAARGQMRFKGHRQGMETVRTTVRYAQKVGISYLTIFSFSSENWSRPPKEVSDLMQLLKFFIRRDLAELDREGVRVRIIGARQGVGKDILKLLDEAEQRTKTNKGLVLVIAFNYGSRDEITRAAQKLAQKVEEGSLKAADITRQMLDNNLDTADIPDPDLLIRTSGEVRLSNFLLWQCAYSELVFIDAYWPDFSPELFAKALSEYAGRDRRFGGLQTGATG